MPYPNPERPSWGRWLVAASIAVAASAHAGAVPWVRGRAPTPVELDQKVTDAVELFDLERREAYLDAAERGEDAEHVVVKQAAIDAGEYDAQGLFDVGDSAFEHRFSELDGYGDAAHPGLLRVHDGVFGGRDAFSCAGCHRRGGANGSGTATANGIYFGDGARVSKAVVRNPPQVLGLGYVQALAAEMSMRLGVLRDEGLARAVETGEPQRVALEAKGVEFGAVTARPDGSVDDSELEGVDPDLVVKPFGWKGHTARLRRFAERAARIHFGVQSHVLAIEHRDDPDPARLGEGPRWWDPDGDGVVHELQEGTLTAMAVYMALLEVPVMLPPTSPALRRRWARGSELFDRVGCSDCHRRELPLYRLEWGERPDTTDGPAFVIHLDRDGEAPRAGQEVRLFSDLRRHDMGDDLADPNEGPDGIARNLFLTRPLWGLAETAPYLHDGRAATIPEAIRWHGGEAATQRGNFEALTDAQRTDLHLFLLSLSREPTLKVAR